MRALFWIANGFDPDDDSRVDSYSAACLGAVLRRYTKLKMKGEEVFIAVINSVVRSRPAGPLLRDTMLDAIYSMHRVREDEVLVLTTQTTGSVSDALSITLFARQHPAVKIELFVTTPAVACHFHTLCETVAWYKFSFRPSIIVTAVVRADSVSLARNLLYQALRMLTRLAALSSWTFSLWYAFLDRVYHRRLHGFGRTVW